MATVSCPQCSQPLEISDSAPEKSVQCPKCQYVYSPAKFTGVASGEPPARSDADAGVTEKAPRSRGWDDADFPQPPKRRDIARKSSLAMPILVVVGVLAFVLFAGGITLGVIFLGFFPVVRMEPRQADALAHAEKAPAEAAKAAEVQAPKFPPHMNQIAEGTAKIRFDKDKEPFVLIECWENGKPSDRFKPVAQRLIGHGGEVSIEIHEGENNDKRTYDIRIADGLGPSSHLFELPLNLKHFVSPLPMEAAVKDGGNVKLCYVCIGKDSELKKNESPEELARRVEYAFVVSLGEAERK